MDGLLVEMVAGEGEALAQVVMMGVSDPPVTASLGPIDRLIRRLYALEGSKHTLPVGLRVNQIGKLREYLQTFRKPLMNLSEMEETSFRAKWWMKEVRELCYDTEDNFVQSGRDGVHTTLGRIARIIISWIHSKLKWRTKISKLMVRAEVLRKTCEKIIDMEIEAPISLKKDIKASISLEKEMKDDISLEKESKAGIEILPAQLVHMLAFDDNNQPQLMVVIISGLAGSGKTTLARTLYVKCKRKFQGSAFVRISRNPDFRSLLTSILSQIKAPSPQGLCDVQGLICSIRDHLQGKRYFIVIDDVRSPSVWDIISHAFPDANFRSRIIVTTQSEQVGVAYSGYKLKSAIFKIAATDDGCTHTTINEKRKVLNIRYNNLSLHLKTCLLYFSMYPEGCTITKDDLAKLWVGEGFATALTRHHKEEISEIPQNNTEEISEVSQAKREEIAEGPQDQNMGVPSAESSHTLRGLRKGISRQPFPYILLHTEPDLNPGPPEGPQDESGEIVEVPQKETEEIAHGYFDELVARGMIQPADINHRGDVLSCTVHHMVLDLIRYKSKEENFIVVVDNHESTLGHPDIVRRLSVQFGCEKGASIPESIILSQVRSLTFYGFLECVPSIADYVLLRVLNLHIWTDEDTIFDITRIGELCHLIYLKIECNTTVRLPLKIQRLQYLGTLELDAKVESIPSDIGHLKKLMHVRCPTEANVRDLGGLTSLQNLQLTYSTVENLEEHMKCLRLILEKLSSLRCLALVPASGSCSANTLPANPSTLCISCGSLCIMSSAPANLQRLELSHRCCIFSRLPKWIGELHELCILKISVRELSREDIGILKGLPAITTLSLHLQTMAAEMIVFGKGGFSVLRHFKLTCNLPCLKIEADAMPNLEKLKLCFNSPIVDEQGTTQIIIIERLLGLKEICAVIDPAGVDAVCDWQKTIRNDPGNPKVQLMGSIYYGDQGKGMVTREGLGEDENKEANIRVHMQPESSNLRVPGHHSEEEPEDQSFISDDIISIPSESESTDGESSSQVVMHGKQTGSATPGCKYDGDGRYSGAGGGLYQGKGVTQGGSSSFGTEDGANAEAMPLAPLRGECSAQLSPAWGAFSEVESPQAPFDLGSVGLGSTPPAVNTHGSGFTDPEKTVKNISTSVPRMGDGNLQESILDRDLPKRMVAERVSVVTGVMNPLIGKLTALMGDEYKKLKGVRKQLSFLRDELRVVNATLHKLELMDELNPALKDLRDHVREMSYDMENCIDNFMYQFGRGDANTGFVRKTVRDLKGLRQRHRITARIEELKTLVVEANARRERYKIDDWKPSSGFVAVDPRLRAVYTEATNLVGIDAPMEELANWLVDTQMKLKVFSIVGFGGLGKTTLAKQLYDKFRGQFHCDAFFSVSQRPDMTMLLHSLEAKLHTTPSPHHCHIEDIIHNIREHLKEKRYLIVVDDLWDQSVWNVFSCVFPDGGNGSRVIVTTRLESVANIACHNVRECIYRIKPLNEHNSRMLFFKSVFGSDDGCPSYFEEVSAAILKKCGGLPLAIITVASLLCSQEISRSNWEKIGRSLRAYSTTDSTLEHMRTILNLSYMHLPLHLRACFLFLGMYPEDEEILMSDVIREWVAEGLVSNLHGTDVMDIGKSYFNELINRSMIQPGRTENGEVVSCRVHNVMLDLILTRCAEDNFLTMASNSEDITRLEGCKFKVRRLSLRSMAGGAIDGLTIGTSLLSQVRSCGWARNSMPPLSLFKYVRVLTLDGDYHGVTIDLTAINRLFQLRYLKVVATHGGIELPSALKGLVHMETLDLIAGYLKNSFPSDIVHLPCLSYLNLPRCAPAIQGVENMKTLRTLHCFDLDNNSVRDIRGLGELTNLIELSFCGRAESSKLDALASSIGKLRNLKHLDTGTAFATDGSNQLGLLSSSPFKNIEKLMLKDWEFPRVPKWMGDLHRLRVLYLCALETSTEDVYVLGKLPSLICLNLKIIAQRVVFGKGLFPVLEQFQFWSYTGDVMAFLVFEEGAMPELRTLSLIVDEWGGSTPVGMEHLIRLEKICLHASTDAKFLLSSWTKDDLVSVFRKASELHPNHPSVPSMS